MTSACQNLAEVFGELCPGSFEKLGDFVFDGNHEGEEEGKGNKGKDCPGSKELEILSKEASYGHLVLTSLS